MKRKLILFAILSFLSIAAQAQIVEIPDSNFKEKLIQIGVDENGDKEIQVDEAASVRSLDISNSEIGNFKGIEAFTGLVYLNAKGNLSMSFYPNTLNLSNATSLTKLDCSNCDIDNILLPKSIKLKEIYANDNRLTELDVSNLSGLERLEISHNSIQLIDLTKNVLLNFLFFDVNNLLTLDLSKNLKLSYANLNYNPNLASLSLNNPSLYFLSFSSTQVSNIDLTQVDSLRGLECSSTKLSSIDVTRLPFLSSLDCSKNRLKSLDVSKNEKLATLDCRSNVRLYYVCAHPSIPLDYPNYFYDISTELTHDCSLITGMENGAENTVNLNAYPNPSSTGNYFIKKPNWNSSYQLIISDVYGNEVAYTMSEQIDKIEFSLSDQGKGTYILKVKEGDRLVTQKLVY